MSTDIASFLGAVHCGEPLALSGLASLAGAAARDLTFSVHESAAAIEGTAAGAVLCRADIESVNGTTQILVDNPRLAFAKVSTSFFPDERPTTGPAIHPSAVIHGDAAVGDGTRIGSQVWLGATVTVGSDCIIRAGTTIGGAGFGFERDEEGRPHRIAHRGSVRIGAGVEIGPNCSIDRAVFDETVIGQGTKLSGQVHVAHQVAIGEDSLVTFGVGFGGGAAIGDRVTIHPHAAIAEGVEIGDDAEIGMNATVLDDVPAGVTVAGSPARRIGSRADADTGGRTT